MKGRIKLRVYVKLNDGKSFKVPAPIGLVKGILSLGNFGMTIAKRYVPEEQRQYIENIDLRELRKGFDVLRDYKGLKLVEVKSMDGTEVTIIV